MKRTRAANRKADIVEALFVLADRNGPGRLTTGGVACAEAAACEAAPEDRLRALIKAQLAPIERTPRRVPPPEVPTAELGQLGPCTTSQERRNHGDGR